MTESKHTIPHPRAEYLVGILTESESHSAMPIDGRARPIALILHGVFAHKNQLYHRSLAAALSSSFGLDSFRFDFRGNDESPGEFDFATFGNDVEDIKMVIEWLKAKNYFVRLIVAHSRACVVALSLLCNSPLSPPPLFVNCSGRYDMHRIWDGAGKWEKQWEEKGYYDWRASVAGKKVVVKLTRDQIERFANFDTSIVRHKMPMDIHVLNVHGTADAIVPFVDAVTYHAIFTSRPGPGTSQLEPIEDAGHNFTGRYHDINHAILRWFAEKDNRPLESVPNLETLAATIAASSRSRAAEQSTGMVETSPTAKM